MRAGFVAVGQLHPDPDEARRWLGTELAHPEYHQENLVERLMTWFERLLSGVAGAAAGVPVLQLVAAVFALVLLLAAVLTLAARARRDSRARVTEGAALPVHRMSAVEHLHLAEAAQAAGEHDTAVVEAYRALVLGHVEDGQVSDLPGATAGELARQIARLEPSSAEAVVDLARTFDTVLYGHRGADADTAARALDLARAGLGVRR